MGKRTKGRVYPNLEAELARNGIRTTREAEAFLGGNKSSLWRWLTGGSDIPLHAAMEIRDKVAPGQSLDYLFAYEPINL